MKKFDLNLNMMVTTKYIGSGSGGRCSRRACPEATWASDVSGLAGSQVWAAGPSHDSTGPCFIRGRNGGRQRNQPTSHHGKLCEHSKKLRFVLLNLGTIRKKDAMVVEIYIRRRINLCGVQETRWGGGICKIQNRMLNGKVS